MSEVRNEPGNMDQPQPSQLSFQSQGTDMTSSLYSSHNDYMALKRALMNEKASPEILEFEVDLLTRLTVRIEQQVRLFSFTQYFNVEQQQQQQKKKKQVYDWYMNE